MPLVTRRIATLMAAFVFTVGLPACDSSPRARNSTTTTFSTRSVSPAARPGSQFDFRVIDLRALPDAPSDLAVPEGYGSRLYSQKRLNGTQTHLVRLDVRTGSVLASYRVRPVPPDAPYDFDIPAAYAFTDDGVVMLDGNRNSVRILDPDRLTVVRTIVLPEGARSDLPPDGDITGPLWVGHKLFNSDVAAGRQTFIGVTRVVPLRNAGAKRSVPQCGSKGGVQPDEATLVIAIECVSQIAIIDLATGATRTLPSWLDRVDVTRMNDAVWARWKGLGYIARLDARKAKLVALDLNADGPLLLRVDNMRIGGGSIWASGIPADPSVPRVLYRIDPRTVQVTARVWGNPIGIVGDAGFMIGSDGRLGTFALSSVEGGTPSKVVRPEPAEARPYVAQNSTEAAILRAFSAVYDYTKSNSSVARYLERRRDTLELRRKLAAFGPDQYRDIHAVVTDVVLKGDYASITYVFTLGGAAAFTPLSASLTRSDGGWVVTRDSLCRIAELASIATC